MNLPQWNPGTLLSMSGEYWKTCTLHAGVKLGVFTAIGSETLDGKTIADRLMVDPRALIMLLNALSALNLLIKTGEHYANTPEAAMYLCKDSPHYIGYMIMHHHHLVESWSCLDQAVRTGKPVRTRASYDDTERRESFLMGMFNNAMGIAPKLVPQIDMADRRHLLDLGGGPGTYAIHFCKHNPHLKATVYDLPTTRPFAEATIARFNLSDRIRFLDGDYIEQGIDGRYDAAWLSHILHAEAPEDCRNIIQKTVSVLEPGGLIMIHEFILDNDMNRPLFPALFSLNMLLGTPGGQSYSEQQIADMLAEAGVSNIQRHSFRGPTDSGIMIGTVMG